jgi:hypothetical protein
MTQRFVDVPLDALVHDRGRVPRVGGVGLPVPVSERLDAFVDSVNQLGGRTNRQELLAAWLCAARPVPNVLKEWVEAYRVTTVGDLAEDERTLSSATRQYELRAAGRPRGS